MIAYSYRPSPKFYNANGTLTDYALACGYIEKKTVNGVSCTLERHAGTRTYSVSSNGRYLRRADYDGQSLTAARAAFRKACRTMVAAEQAAMPAHV